MSQYKESKKARYMAAIIYLIFMAVILGGTYLSEQYKAEQKTPQSSSPVP